MKAPKLLAAGLSAALAAGTVSAIALAAPASAATGTTATVSSWTVNDVGGSWFDNGTYPKPAENPGPNRDIELTAVADGNDIDFTIELSGGPSSGAFSGFTANKYKLDALVRLDGAAGTPGKMFVGPIGTADVAALSPTFTDGVTITGTFENVAPGDHTVTLTNLVMDADSGSPTGSTGGFASAISDYTGFDAYYAAGGTNRATIITAPANWLQESVSVTGATVTSVSNQVTGVTNYVRPSATATVTLSGANYDDSLASGSITAAFCDAAGANCNANATNTLSTNGSGDLSGTVSVATGTTAGARTIKISDGVNTTLTPINVLAAAAITIEPSQAQVGNTVEITATNFDPQSNYIAYAGIQNQSAPGVNSFYALANGTNGGCTAVATPNAACIATGPYIPGASNPIVSGTVGANGSKTAVVTVNDPNTIKIAFAGKSITAGVSAGGADMTSLGQSTAKSADFTVLADTTAPTGTASLTGNSGPIGKTVSLTINPADNAGAANVTATVNWGDGTAAQTLATGAKTATHKYNKLGTFGVKVTLKDAANNTSAVISAGNVSIKDTTKPSVTLTTPKKASAGKSWTTIKGKVADKGGSGVKAVTVQLIEKKGGKWYAFTGTKWVKVASQKKALAKAKKLVDSSVSTGAWSVKAKKPGVGTLYVYYSVVDKAGNKNGTSKSFKIKS